MIIARYFAILKKYHYNFKLIKYNLRSKVHMIISEKEKMISGELYNSMDKELAHDRTQAKLLFRQFNDTDVIETEYRVEILKKLFGEIKGSLCIEQPFYCTYGYNISWGNNSYANYSLTILDNGKVTIGDNVMIGPNVQLLTACHAIDAEERNKYIEFTKPITIKNNVWIGAGVIVVPGVTIGNNSIIGAGSVVTKDIPDNVVAVGNPCKVIREVTDEDKLLK